MPSCKASVKTKIGEGLSVCEFDDDDDDGDGGDDDDDGDDDDEDDDDDDGREDLRGYRSTE